MNLFAPSVRIDYTDNWAIVTTFDNDGNKHPDFPQEVPYEQVPVMLFQLVDHGYIIQSSKIAEYTTIITISPEWISRTWEEVKRDAI